MSKDPAGAPGSRAGTAAEPAPGHTGNALEAALARAARVAELREALAAGRYRPDPVEVAKAVLSAHSRRPPSGGDR